MQKKLKKVTVAEFLFKTKLPYSKVAEYVGCTAAAISCYKRGISYPSIYFRKKVDEFMQKFGYTLKEKE